MKLLVLGTLLTGLLLVVQPADVATRCLSAPQVRAWGAAQMCCCYNYTGNLCCNEQPYCSGFVSGCICKR